MLDTPGAGQELCAQKQVVVSAVAQVYPRGQPRSQVPDRLPHPRAVDRVERILKINGRSHFLGIFAVPVQPLPGDDVKKLLEARTKAGLGRAGRR